MVYKTLRSDCVIETIDRLHQRISERFPDAGLVNVAAELAATARRCADEAALLNRPAVAIRLCVYTIWTLGAGAFIWLTAGLHYDGFSWQAARLVQILEPAMNIVVLTGIGVLTLGKMEERWKRRRALDYLHELRSIAHVVDMHQLTKDPYRTSGVVLPATKSSPKQALHGALLERYLDYCSELASLTGKLAALLAQSCRDGEVAAAASDIEQLATGLSRKIWQKIMVLGRSETCDGAHRGEQAQRPLESLAL
ncbi:MAG: hypothetical protein AAGJ73_13765 [Pseudomonadota bacterium]